MALIREAVEHLQKLNKAKETVAENSGRWLGVDIAMTLMQIPEQYKEGCKAVKQLVVSKWKDKAANNKPVAIAIQQIWAL